MQTRAGVVVLVVVLLLTVSVCAGADWPQFHGPNRDGKSAETGLLKKWPDEGPKLLWSVEGLGGGFSSVAVSDGYVYTTGMVGDEKEGILSVYDTGGTFRWKASYGPEWSGSHPGARSTPTIDSGRVYVISGYGNLVCFEAKTSAKLWEVDVLKRFDGKNINWGISEAVLISDEKVICTPGGKDAAVVALDKKTGETIWRTKGLSDSSAYCAAITVERGGKKLVVTITAQHIVGIDAANGNVLWQHGNKLRKGKPVNPNSPVYQDGSIYVTSRFIGGTKFRICEDGTTVTEERCDKSIDPHHGGFLLVDGYIYAGSTKVKKWICLDWQSGKVMYEHKWLGKGSIIFADGMLYLYEEKEGTVGLVKPSAESFDLVSSFEVPMGTGPHWSHLAISDGRLYVRHGDALMAYDIKAGS
jgi:outer membrane protein assembly factor BamB